MTRSQQGSHCAPDGAEAGAGVGNPSCVAGGGWGGRGRSPLPALLRAEAPCRAPVGKAGLAARSTAAGPPGKRSPGSCACRAQASAASAGKGRGAPADTAPTCPRISCLDGRRGGQPRGGSGVPGNPVFRAGHPSRPQERRRHTQDPPETHTRNQARAAGPALPAPILPHSWVCRPRPSSLSQSGSPRPVPDTPSPHQPHPSESASHLHLTVLRPVSSRVKEVTG